MTSVFPASGGEHPHRPAALRDGWGRRVSASGKPRTIIFWLRTSISALRIKEDVLLAGSGDRLDVITASMNSSNGFGLRIQPVISTPIMSARRFPKEIRSRSHPASKLFRGRISPCAPC